MGDAQVPEKVHNTCMKTMHARMKDRGITVPLYGISYFHPEGNTLA
jgi:hypothetical protein